MWGEKKKENININIFMEIYYIEIYIYVYICIFPFNLLFSIDSSLLLVSPGGNSFDFWQDWGEDWEGGF